MQESTNSRRTYVRGSTTSFPIESSVEAWCGSEQALAGFTARYLNAVRSNEDELRAWAKGGLDGSPPPNACRSCDLKEACHATFGRMGLGRF